MDEGENNELFEAYVEDFEEKIIEVDDYFDVLVSEIGKKKNFKIFKRKNSDTQQNQQFFKSFEDYCKK
jgi:hypothetical protein